MKKLYLKYTYTSEYKLATVKQFARNIISNYKQFIKFLLSFERVTFNNILSVKLNQLLNR